MKTVIPYRLVGKRVRGFRISWSLVSCVQDPNVEIVLLYGAWPVKQDERNFVITEEGLWYPISSVYLEPQDGLTVRTFADPIEQCILTKKFC